VDVAKPPDIHVSTLKTRADNPSKRGMSIRAIRKV
jgi:hypothetical protein